MSSPIRAVNCSTCRPTGRRYCNCKIQTVQPRPTIVSEDLTPGTELRFGSSIVRVVQARDDGEQGIWVELSTGDVGHSDRGAVYDLAYPL